MRQNRTEYDGTLSTNVGWPQGGGHSGVSSSRGIRFAREAKLPRSCSGEQRNGGRNSAKPCRCRHTTLSVGTTPDERFWPFFITHHDLLPGFHRQTMPTNDSSDENANVEHDPVATLVEKKPEEAEVTRAPAENRPYSAFTKAEKWLIVVLISLASFFR
jgi:hypothetical protein